MQATVSHHKIIQKFSEAGRGVDCEAHALRLGCLATLNASDQGRVARKTKC